MPYLKSVYKIMCVFSLCVGLSCHSDSQTIYIWESWKCELAIS